MLRTLDLLLCLTLLACSETPERDEPTTGAYIVSIDPPILDEGQPHEAQINLGELTEDGWQPITVTFSAIPKDLWVYYNYAYPKVSQWVLKGRVLTIRTSCAWRRHQWYPGRTTAFMVSWDTGYIQLTYKCPD